MKKLLLCIFLLSGFSILFGQKFKDTVYLDKNFNKVNKIRAYYYRCTAIDSITNLYFISDWWASGKIYKKGMYSDYKGRVPEGAVYSYYPDGQVKYEATYKNGMLNGEVRSYYTNGKIGRVEKYENNKLLAAQYYTKEGKDTTMLPFFRLPAYKGGFEALQKFIANSIIYPRDAANRGIEGTVIVGFVIKKEGYVRDIAVVSTANYILNKEAERVIYLTKKDWEPGIEDGELADVAITYPVVFKWAKE